MMRAPVQYYGGKGLMRKRLLAVVPPGGKPYCEPYCGGASLFFARDPAPNEVLNDLNEDLVNLFRCLQNPVTAAELERRLHWTLYSLAEYVRAIKILEGGETDPVLRAWAFYVRQNQGFSGLLTHNTAGAWSRTFVSSSGMAIGVSRWLTRKQFFSAWCERLQRVQIDCRDAIEVINYWDNQDAVFYVDPPYVSETRKTRAAYTVEASLEHHQELVQTLLRCRGAVVLSGYDHPVYAPLVDAGWDVMRWTVSASVAGRIRGSRLRGAGSASSCAARTEVVWRNARAEELCGRFSPEAVCVGESESRWMAN